MPEFLVFQVHGPMVSWGATAVGEERPSLGQPSKSAILGLLAGSMGLRRDEEQQQAGFFNAYGMAVSVDGRGVLSTDYHTVQAPAESKGGFYETRKDELSADPRLIKTLLSSRQYRNDALYRILIWIATPNPPYSLAELAEGLRRPVLTPYLGRKSCPPALPFDPKVVDAPDIKEALGKADFKGDEFLGPLPLDPNPAVYWEAGVEPGFETIQSFTRRDRVVSRRRWQFGERTEFQGRSEPAGDKEG